MTGTNPRNPYSWEHKNVQETIEDQINTVNGISDNATRTLKVVLLAIAGIFTGALTLSLPEFPLHPVPIILTISLVFFGIFYLISASMGVGISLEHLVAEEDYRNGGIDELLGDDLNPETVETLPHLKTRLDDQLCKIETNEEVIEASRRLMLIADGSLSAGTGVLILMLIDILNHVHSFVPIPIIHYIFPPVFILISFIIFLTIDRKYPSGHDVLNWEGSFVRENKRSLLLFLVIFFISAGMFHW